MLAIRIPTFTMFPSEMSHVSWPIPDKSDKSLTAVFFQCHAKCLTALHSGQISLVLFDASGKRIAVISVKLQSLQVAFSRFDSH